jgi:Fe-S oxidoreductase
MCNNNGHCRKFDAGTMCPSYRVTRNERDLTRGRANSLRLALSGQLGDDALVSDEMYRTMELCVSCKGCKRECPTGVDMAAMKIEFLHHYHRRHRRTLKDKLVAYLPRYAPTLARVPGLANLRNQIPGLGYLAEQFTGLSASRKLPVWCRDRFLGQAEVPGNATGPEVVLLADTFNAYFEPENLRAAVAVFAAANYNTVIAEPVDGGRPLCCGRTYLATGMIDEARTEAQRMLHTLRPYVQRGVPIVGLEPSCLLGLRDEFKLMLPGEETDALAELALTFEEFLARENAAGRLELEVKKLPQNRALVHGHCHQKAFDVMHPVSDVLGMIPGLEVEHIQSGCCGMAGAFGYEAKHVDISRKMAEASLLPAVRGAGDDTVIVADGTSCRQQIRDGTQQNALHVARVLAGALAD